MIQPSISIIIPTWNHREILRRCLESIPQATQTYGGTIEVVVVDDHSTDGTAEMVTKQFPDARLIVQTRNNGFGASINLGVKQARHELVYLMNNDTLLTSNFFEPLVTHFNNAAVFAVAPSMRLPDQRPGDRTTAVFVRGFFEFPIEAVGHAAPNILVGGGAGLYRRNTFMSLGGYDPIYHPFYYEDLDLCYRAWKRGFYCLSEPRSIVHHEHSSTIGARFSQQDIQRISERNFYLFHWINITDTGMLARHVYSLLLRLVKNTMLLNYNTVFAIVMAFTRLGMVAKRRRSEVGFMRMTDREVLERVAPGGSPSIAS